MESTEPNGQTGWQDVAEASSSQPETRSELVTDAIKVPITMEALARIARENADDDLKKQELETELDDLKEKVKDKKAEIDVVTARMGERHESVRNGEQTLRGQWRVVDVFATNTVQYFDPATDKLVHERPMSASERQQELPLGRAEDDDDGVEPDGEPIEAADDETTITTPEALLDGSAAEEQGRVRRRRKKDTN